MAKEPILITVKTYPTLSTKYGETVCTAGVRPDGTWVRIYPVPFRRLEEGEQYKKFDWVNVRLARNTSDIRPETFRPADVADFVKVDHLDTDQQWRERRRVILEAPNAKVYTRLDELIAAAKANTASLAVFKPTKVLDFIHEQDERDWRPERVQQMRDLSKQHELFADNTWRETFNVIPKLPFKFSYRFEDETGKKSELQVLDWEAGALYWNCLRRANGDEKVAIAKVKQKYLDEFAKTELHFFVGTTQQWHSVAPNPWIIIGVFPIPHQRQAALF